MCSAVLLILLVWGESKPCSDTPGASCVNRLLFVYEVEGSIYPTKPKDDVSIMREKTQFLMLW